MTEEQLGFTLRNGLETQLDALRREIQLEFQSRDQALALAAAAQDDRLEHLNHLREDYATQKNEFLTKGEAQLRFDNLERDVRSLLLAQASVAGKASQNAVIFAWGLGGAGIAMGIVNILMRIMGK